MRPSKALHGMLGAAMLTALSLPAAGQESPQTIDLASWDTKDLASGISVEQMLGAATVYDRDGEVVGRVEDLIMGPDGKVRKLVIEAGGFLDVGDTHFAYPIGTANIESAERVLVRFDKDMIPSYSLFADIDDQPAAGRNWRITELLHDYALLEDRTFYGWVKDVVMSEQGEIRAVIVFPDIGHGARGVRVARALPFYGYDHGFDPGAIHYRIPHGLEDVRKLEPFVYPNFPRGGN